MLRTLETELLCRSEGIRRKGKFLWKQGTSPEQLCLFLDAEYYLEKMQVEEIVSRVVQSSSDPPLLFCFLSHGDSVQRHQDYTCNPLFAEFLATELTDWSRTQFPHLRQHDHLIAGLSLSGLQSAYTKVCYPRVFRSVISQSGSFWWNEQWLRKQTGFSWEGRFYLSVGDQEVTSGETHLPGKLYQGVSQLESVTQLAHHLSSRNAELNFQEYAGGHELAPWRSELEQALCWSLRRSSR